MTTTKSDLEIWREDDVRQCGLDRLFVAHNLTAQEAGVAGGITDVLRQAGEDDSDGRKARIKLGRITHLLLNIMRAESGLEFTEVIDPNQWPASDLSTTIKQMGKKRKRVAGTGTGAQAKDQFVEVPYVKQETGWGNDVLVNTNPPNFDGEKNTNDARPGWWYRMVFLPENRDTVLALLDFFKPEDCEPSRREHLLDLDRNPRRKKALDLAKRVEAMSDEVFAPKRGRKPAAVLEN